MEETEEEKPEVRDIVVYQATFSIKMTGFRTLTRTCVVLSDSTCTPARVRKELLEDIKARYAGMPLPVKAEVKQLKKVKSDFVTMVWV